VSVTASGYMSGQSVAFYEGGSGTRGLAALAARWRGDAAQRRSAARSERDRFHHSACEGTSRILPRWLNAADRTDRSSAESRRDRALIIGTGRASDEPPSALDPRSVAGAIAGHALNSIFLAMNRNGSTSRATSCSRRHSRVRSSSLAMPTPWREATSCKRSLQPSG
jgi:hypothetical protein